MPLEIEITILMLNNNGNWHFLEAYSVSGTVLNALRALSDLILTKTLVRNAVRGCILQVKRLNLRWVK